MNDDGFVHAKSFLSVFVYPGESIGLYETYEQFWREVLLSGRWHHRNLEN